MAFWVGGKAFDLSGSSSLENGEIYWVDRFLSCLPFPINDGVFFFVYVGGLTLSYGGSLLVKEKKVCWTWLH